MKAREFLTVCPICGHTLLTRSEDKTVLTCFKCDTQFEVLARLINVVPDKGGQIATDRQKEGGQPT